MPIADLLAPVKSSSKWLEPNKSAKYGAFEICKKTAKGIISNL